MSKARIQNNFPKTQILKHRVTENTEDHGDQHKTGVLRGTPWDRKFSVVQDWGLISACYFASCFQCESTSPMITASAAADVPLAKLAYV